MGSMHHSGFMISLKQGLMKMNGNIFDGKNISNSEILEMPNPLGNMPANLICYSSEYGHEDDNG
jgi:hypothetical protein